LDHKRTDESLSIKGGYGLLRLFRKDNTQSLLRKALAHQVLPSVPSGRSKHSQRCQEGNFDPHKSPVFNDRHGKAYAKAFWGLKDAKVSRNQESLRL